MKMSLLASVSCVALIACGGAASDQAAGTSTCDGNAQTTCVEVPFQVCYCDGTTAFRFGIPNCSVVEPDFGNCLNLGRSAHVCFSDLNSLGQSAFS